MARRSRKEKYPDTQVFHNFNANPKNRITGDCRIRAICTACEVPYNQVVMDLAKIQCETGYDQTTNQGLDILLKQYGWVKCSQPRKIDNTKYTGKELCKLIQNGKFPNKNMIINIGGHHMACIIDGKIWDIWNSTEGCVGNYWVKCI